MLYRDLGLFFYFSERQSRDCLPQPAHVKRREHEEEKKTLWSVKLNCSFSVIVNWVQQDPDLQMLLLVSHHKKIVLSNCWVWVVMRVWRVHRQEQRLALYGVLRWVLVWMSVCFLVFTIGQPSRWRLKESASTQSPCPSCDCYCSSAEYPLGPLGEFHFSVTLQSNKLGFEWGKKNKFD